MRSANRHRMGVLLWLLPWLHGGHCASGVAYLVIPEQRTIQVRDPATLPHAQLPAAPPPATVETPRRDDPVWLLSLDEAIRVSLANTRVVRVLAGVTAVSSGRTIYDPAIANTNIDQERARFDPNVQVNNAFNRFENPQAVLDPSSPAGARITGTRTDDYDLNLGLSKTTVTGGTASLNLTDNVARFHPGLFPLNPQERSALTLSYTQPLLQGAGLGPNLAPLVVAQLETERSFFQFKDSVQDMVRGVIEAYWALVAARTDVWARQQQVEQGRGAYERSAARLRRGLGSASEVAQTRLALANFEADLIGAEARRLDREAALRNIMGLPPNEPRQIVPVTPPSDRRLAVNWEKIVQLAEERRPDLIELKLILEADLQLLQQAQNQSLPRLDAVALYRWNGLEGKTPARTTLSSGPGEFTDWTLGVNFSVPLGLRQGRAALRRTELLIERDRANLDQGFHNMLHQLAANLRNLAQFYEQYLAFKEARRAAQINLDQQLAEFRAGRVIFLNVLQAITDWGNAITAEARALTQYNTELANLERQTGTILETHGITFYQERFGSIGPLGRGAAWRCYPASLPPGPNQGLYPAASEPAENFFELDSPLRRDGKPPERSPTPPPKQE